MDRLMDAVFGDTRQVTGRTPAVDVWEEQDRYVMEMEMPGLGTDDVDVHVEENLLTIQSARTGDEREQSRNGSEEEHEERSYVLRERRHGDFVRSFSLPKDVDTNAIEASARNGVLSITLGKQEQAKPRSIEVKPE
jgi:HSP20 family protein